MILEIPFSSKKDETKLNTLPLGTFIGFWFFLQNVLAAFLSENSLIILRF